MAHFQLDDEDLSSYAGPTPWCNWVIKGKVMAGGYPACMDDDENDELLVMLMRDVGVDCFVCLQSEVNPNASEFAWRTGRAPRPYMRDLRRILAKHRTEIPHAKVDFLHLPIVDGLVTADPLVDSFCNNLIARVEAGQCLYIHCWGGHGRTGTVVAVMLGRMFNMSTQAAINRTQRLHDTRGNPQDCRSPSTPCQRAQVKRLLGGSQKLGNPTPSARMMRGGRMGSAGASSVAMGVIGHSRAMPHTAGVRRSLQGGGGSIGSQVGAVPLPPVPRISSGGGGVGRPQRGRTLSGAPPAPLGGRRGGYNAGGLRAATPREQPVGVGVQEPPPPPAGVNGLPRRRPLRRGVR